MTREEVRVLTLAKLRTAPGQIVWDVGSGTGSISIEAARLVPGGHVYAVERSKAGLELTKQNCLHFGVENITLIPGEAPGVLDGLPCPHRVVVGGSGGKLKEIIDLLNDKLLPGGRVVFNAVTLETLTGAVSMLKYPWVYEVVHISLSRSEEFSGGHLLRSLSTVFIISAWKEEGHSGG